MSGSVQGRTDRIVGAIEYAINMNVSIISNSWSVGKAGLEFQGYDVAMYEVVKQTEEAGILFVASAGNSARNNDGTGEEDNDSFIAYPASYPFSNIISVVATDKNNQLAEFSSYGKTTTHIGAPGVDIFSTLPRERVCTTCFWKPKTYQVRYGSEIKSFLIQEDWNGTSMATPHVSGALAMYLGMYPDATYSEARHALLNSARPSSHLLDKTLTGGVLDIPTLLEYSVERVRKDQPEKAYEQEQRERAEVAEVSTKNRRPFAWPEEASAVF